ncbi:MAG: oligosaccharide flippase family protein [Halobacteriota archaeon]
MGEYTQTVRRLGLSSFIKPLEALSTIFLVSVLTKTLPITDYGSWALVTTTIGLLPLLVTLGLPSAMIRFGAAANKRDLQDMFYSIGSVVLVASIAASALFFLVAPQIAASLFQNNLAIALLLIGNILIACVNHFLLQYFITLQQIKRYALLNFFNAYLSLALIAFFVLSGYGLAGAMTALLIQQLVVLPIMMYLIITQIGVAIPKFEHLRPNLAYGFPLVPGLLSSWIVNSSDRYLVAFFLGTAAVGYYSPGYSLGSAISMLSAPLAMLLPAVLSKHYDEDNIASVRTIMAYSLKYYVGIALPSVFALSVLSKPLLAVITTQEIAAQGYLVTPFVAAGAALLGGYYVLVMVIALKKKTVVTAVVWALCAILNFGLNLVLIPYLGFVGAAVTTFLAFLLAVVLTTLYSFKHFRFDMNSGFIVKSVCSSIIMALFLFFWNPSGIFSILLSVVLAALLYVGVLLALRGLTIQELKLIYRIYKGSY